MIRKIEIGNVTYICDVNHVEDIEFWSCPKGELIADYLTNNGAIVNSCEYNGYNWTLEVDRTRYNFMGESYWQLNQCEGDLFQWFVDSLEGDFTYYFDKIVFHTQNGFVGAYRDDITNTIKL